jgi:hypothetical protein
MSYFVPGEEEFAVMTAQLKKMGLKEDKRKIYKANGVMRLAEYSDLEVLVLEIAGAFDHGDQAKITLDNFKGHICLCWRC